MASRRRARAPVLLSKEEDDRGAAVVGWAASYSTGPIGGRQVSFCQVSPSLSFYFYFLFCFSVFDLVIILNHF